MCGIVGITSTKKVSSTILNSLRKLEYRGYDSAGIATLENGLIKEVKCEGRVDALESNLSKKKLEGKVSMVSFQDSRDSAIEFLNNYGYGQIIYAVDTQSKLAIDSGVFGVPETHIIVNGEIVKKFIGPLSLSNVEEIINNFP